MVVRVFPILAAALALAVGADTAQASASYVPAASDTLRVTLSAPEGGTVAEGMTGHFVVAVAGSTAAGAVKVRYSVSGTAVAGEDYTALSGEATAAPGESVARIALEALEDGILDKGETVVLTLTGATGPGTLVVDQTAATATIADNGSVKISLTAVPDTIGEGSAWSSTMTMSTPVADRVSVRWWTSDGTALAGRDYAAADEVVSFRPGETSKRIEVQTLKDDNTEAVEVFYVSLGLPYSSARTETEDAVEVDPKPQSAFIECSVRFPPDIRTVFRLNEPVSSGTVIGTVAAETHSFAVYSLGGGGNKFKINVSTAEISTTAVVSQGSYPLTVSVLDDCGGSASVNVIVVVNGAPEPVGTIPDGTVKKGKSGSVDVSSYFSDPENGALTYTASSSAPSVVGVSVSGSKVTYEGLKAGSATVTVTATDSGRLAATQSFRVTVTQPNRSPTPEGTIKDRTVDVGNSGSVDVSSKFSDADDDALTYSVTSSDETKVGVSVQGSEVTYTAKAAGSATVTVTATDPGNLSAAQRFTVTVPNRPPTVKGTIPNGTVHVGRTGSVGVLSKFDDPDDDKLTYMASSSHPDLVSVIMSGSNVKYSGESVGSAQVTVRATDPSGLFVEQMFTVTVPNRPPTAVKAIKHQTVHVGKTGSVGVSSNFDDPDGDELTFKAASLDAKVVRVSVSGSTVEYMGVGVGSAFVSVTATDPGGLEATQSFVVTVPNRPPTAKGTIKDRTIKVGESGSVDVISRFEDPDDDPLTYAVQSSEPTVVGVSVTAGEVTYEGLKAGSAKVTVTATDPGNLSATQSFEVTVVRVNERPTARAGADQWVDEGELVKLDGSGSTDPDGTIDKWRWTGPLTLTNPNAAKASFTAPAVDTATAYTFTLKVWDDDDATDTDWMKVTVEPVDTTTTCSAPVANAGANQTVREQRRVTLDGSGSRDASSYAWRQVGGQTVTLSGANTKTPSFDTPLVSANEVLTFRLTATSACGATNTDDVRVTVRDNRAPEPRGTIPVQPVLKGASGTVSVAGYFRDPDGDALTYAATSAATGVAGVSVTGSTVKYTGKAVGGARVTVTAKDGYGATARQEFRVTVSDPPPTNNAPEIESAISAREVVAGASEAVVVSSHFSDPDNDALTFSASSSKRTVATVSVSVDTVWVGGVSKGTADVTVTARDPYGAEVSQAFRVTVKAGNDAPEVVSAIPALTLNSGDSKVVDVSSRFRDPDGDALTYEASSSTEAAATVAVSGSGVTVTGVSPGESRVTVTARDGRGGSVSQDFTVTVENQAPEIVSAIPALTVAAGSSKAVDVSAHFRDPNGDALTYAAKSATEAAATVAVSGSEVTVTGVSEGESEVTVTVRDTHGAEVSQGFTATVGPDNEAPVVASAIPALTVAAGETAVVDVSAHFSDPDDDALTYEAESSNEGAATVALSGSEVTVTGVLHGESRVTVTARDGRGGSASQDFAVTVPNRPPEPVGSLDRAVAYRAVTTTVEVSGAFSDPDGDGLTYRAVPADGGIVSVWVSGSQVRLQGRLRKSTTVTVTADDGHGGTAQQTFEVEVANHPPVAVNRMRPRTIAPGERFTVTLSDYFRDTDGDAMTYTGVVSDSTVADVSVEGEELVVVGESRGRVVVTAKAHDGHGGTGLQWFPLTVTNGRPVFDADAYEREVAENSVAGTAVGDPVTATDDDGDDVAYGFISGGDEAPFGIDAASGQITVAEGAVLDYESGTTAYAVRVEASDGTRADTAAVTIRVTDVPAPGRPDAPVVTGGTEEVAVSWSAPANAGPAITNYDLRYRAKADSEWTDVSALGAVLARTITGLEAGTAYQVQVRAESSEGAGAWSEPGEGTTETANRAPSFDAAAYERSVPENSAAGTAVGEPVTATDDDGDDLAYSFLPGGEEAPFEIVAATGQIRVAGGAALDYESGTTVYTVSVRASDGTRADTAAVTIRVTDVPAPGKPDAPVVKGGTEEVAVSWTAPANEGPAITGYDLRYRAKADDEWTDVSALGAVLAHTITDLNGGTTYQVQVRAESSEGAGEWSEPGEGTTETANTAPSFDADAYERSVAENSAAGTAVGEPVTATDDDGDDLAYSFLAGGDEARLGIDAASGQISVAEGAALDHEGESNSHVVQVVASDGTRADTAAVTIRVTDVPAPGKPDAPVVTGGTEEVAVSWSAPANQGSEITGYGIRHRTKSGGEWTAPKVLGVVLAHTITDLNGGTTYQVQVRAESSEGAGEWSEPGEGTTEAANRAPSFDAETYEREIPENSPAGTAVGEPVTATDDGGELAYRFVTGGEAPFEIDAATGRITVAEGAALDYESGETQFTVRVEASDGELADIASVTIRVTNADDQGVLTLSPEVARVGVELTATLTDEDGVRGAGRNRKWQRSADGNSWNDIGTGRMYNPVTADAGRWLRAVFTYADGHGPGKRAVSERVKVLAANAAPAFEADAYEREVPENSEGGTKIGRPVRATDGDGDELVYGIVGGGDEAPFEIHAATGRIRVAVGAVLNYESGDTLYTVGVEASDGELADTASVTIRVTDADDPGEVALAPEVARVGVELTADLTDEDGAHGAGRKRKWQRSADGNSWNDIASGRRYTPVTTDEGRWLRAVFEYTDGHGPDKRAVSAPVKVLAANAAPSFAAVYEREVPENSPGGTRVGAPVAATDPDNTALSYSFASGGDEALFEIGAATGQITVADGAALDYESGDTLLAVRVEASDGELADTASVKIRMTNADDPGKITLSADVARVGVRLTATLMDQDRSVERSKMRTWQRSPDGATWTMVVQGAARRFYTPTAADRGQYLRAVFTYTDGHGPGKRAESAAVSVVGASTPVVSFGADSYTAAPVGSADVAVLLSPAASSALAIEVAAGETAHTVTFQPGASSATVAVGTAGLSASDTLAVRFGTLPDGVAVGVPATTRIIVAAAAGDRVSRSVAQDGTPVELEVEYAQAEYVAVAGGPDAEITLRVSPAADRRVAVPLTVGQAISPEPAVPDSVVFEPGDSLAAFMLDVPAGTEPGLLALGLGVLPEAVSAGAVASATVDIAAGDAGALRDEAFEVGLAVFGRAVAEGARQAVGARIDAVMRPTGRDSSAGVPGSASEWAGSAAGTLASLAGLPLGASSSADMARRRSGSLELPTGREVAGRLLPRVSFATGLGPQAAQGRPRFGLWAEGSTQSFRGEPGIDYDGGLRALTVGADARIGSSGLLGVSLMRSAGDLDYGNRSVDGSLGHAMNSIHPYLFLQPSPRIGLWAMAGYGSGDVRDDDRHGDTGASLRMLAGGVKVPLARRGAFGLALTGDAFTVGMRASDRGGEGSASRARALLEASWTAGGLKLATQAGARYDAGDADTGGGAETGASVGYAGHGFDLDLRGRLALGSGRHREWGAALRLAFDPGTRDEGFRLAISPGHGHDQSGIHGLMDGRALQAVSPNGLHSREWHFDAEAGYALKNSGGGGAFDGYTRLLAGAGNRAWSIGTGYRVSQTIRLGIEGSRTRSPRQPGSLGLRLALDYKF